MGNCHNWFEGAHGQQHETIWHFSSDPQPPDGNLLSWGACKEQRGTRGGGEPGGGKRNSAEMTGGERAGGWGRLRRWQGERCTVIILAPFSQCTGVRWDSLQTVLSGQWPKLGAAWLILPVKGPFVQLCQSWFLPTGPLQLPPRRTHMNQHVETPAESKWGWQHFPAPATDTFKNRCNYTVWIKV